MLHLTDLMSPQDHTMQATASRLHLTTVFAILHFCRWCRQHRRHEQEGSEMVCFNCASQVLLSELDQTKNFSVKAFSCLF